MMAIAGMNMDEKSRVLMQTDTKRRFVVAMCLEQAERAFKKKGRELYHKPIGEDEPWGDRDGLSSSDHLKTHQQTHHRRTYNLPDPGEHKPVPFVRMRAALGQWEFSEHPDDVTLIASIFYYPIARGSIVRDSMCGILSGRTLHWVEPAERVRIFKGWQAENIRIPKPGSYQNPYWIPPVTSFSGDYEAQIKKLPDYSWYT
jgi:hypothetical protein